MITRLRIVGVIFGIFFVALIARLFYWQVIHASELSIEGRSQYQSQAKKAARRGSILASDESWLVSDADAYLVYAEKPKLTETARAIANKLAPLFVMDPTNHDELLKEAERLEGVLNQDGVWFPLKHKVSSDLKNNIAALKIAGIGFDEEDTRSYPEGSSGAQVVGFVGKDDAGDDKGYFGLEGYYDLVLSGKPGFTLRESDVKGVPILFGASKELSAVAGVDLLTHIDKRIQMTIEKKLKDGIDLYGAKSGTVILMDPKTGGIMGMASYPSYDPAKYWEYKTDDYKNPAVTDTFEPGSIFKPIIMAAALDDKSVEPDTKCDICSGPFKVDKYTIETWNNEYHPDSTMTDVIVNSDNVGMTYVGNKLGADKLYDYLDKFGFGHTTGIDLQGEVTPQIRNKGSWNIVDLATTTFGQGIAVTPIQVLRAIGAIANGGKLVTPQIVSRLQKDSWGQDIKPLTTVDVISEKASEQIRDMMVAAIDRGEAKWAAPKGFKIAGKTGTAQIPVAGHYDPTKTIASFVGFAPADNPKFVMIVILHEPTSSIWGSETAAPLWFDIAKDLFPYLGIQPGS